MQRSLVVATLVYLGMALSLSGCDLGGLSGAEHYQRATQYYADGEINASIIELKNALQLDPDFADARWLLGDIYLKLGNGSAALKELLRAQRAGYAGAELEHKLLQAYLLNDDYDAVLAATPDIDSGAKDPRLVALRAEALLGKNEVEAAIVHFERAIELDLNTVHAHLGLARVALVQRRLDDARTHLDGAEAIDAENIHLWLLRGELRLAARNPESAEAAYRRSAEILRQNPYATLGIARALLAQGKTDEALVPLSELRTRYPNLIAGKYLAALAEFQQQKLEQARDLLLDILRNTPNHPHTLLLLGNVSLSQKLYEQSEEFITRFNAIVPGYAPALRMLAAVQIQRNKASEAIATLESLDNDATNAQHLALLGSAHLRQGNLSEGTELLEQAAEKADHPAGIRTQLALGYLAAGNTERAISELEGVLQLDESIVQADIVLIFTYLRESQFDKALAAATVLKEKQPDSPIAFSLIGTAYVGKGDRAAAREHFERAVEIRSQFTPAMVSLANLDYDDGNVDAARIRLEQVIGYDETNLHALIVLARLAATREEFELAMDYLQRARGGHPIAALPRVMLAEHYLMRNDAANALALATEAIELAPDLPEAMLALGQAQTASRQYVDAVATLERLTAAVPDSAEIRYRLGLAQMETREFDAARQSFDTALSIKSDDLRMLSARTMIDIRTGDVGAARARIEEIRSAYPDAAAADALSGDVHVHEKNHAAATAAYEQAFAKAPSSPLALKLFDARMNAGQKQLAMRELETWLQQNPTDFNAAFSLARAVMADQRFADATARYEALAQQAPKNFMVLNDLAWLYQQQHDDKALGVAESAYALAPNRPDVLDTYGWILVELKQVERGLGLLARAVETAPGIADIRYHYASALAKTGDREHATAQLQQALATTGGFTERKKAEALLEELQNP